MEIYLMISVWMTSTHFPLFSDHRIQSQYFGEEFETDLIEFCPWIGADLQAFDANGDGYDDLTCHTSTGFIQISESHIVEQRAGGVSVEQGIGGMSVDQATTSGTVGDVGANEDAGT